MKLQIDFQASFCVVINYHGGFLWFLWADRLTGCLPCHMGDRTLWSKHCDFAIWKTLDKVVNKYRGVISIFKNDKPSSSSWEYLVWNVTIPFGLWLGCSCNVSRKRTVYVQHRHLVRKEKRSKIVSTDVTAGNTLLQQPNSRGRCELCQRAALPDNDVRRL